MRLPTCSVIIPTKDRPEDFFECIDSILKQDHLPEEIIIIDQSTTPVGGKPVKAKLASLPSPPDLIYLYAPELDGLPQARNLGVSKSSGEIIMFLDDDVKLQESYLSEILGAFSTTPQAIGLGGIIKPRPALGQALLARIFYHGPFKGEREILTIQHDFLKKSGFQNLIPVNYISGCNMSFRRSIFDNFKFDERLKKDALGEDMVFSYLISQNHKLFVSPKTYVFHKGSVADRLKIEKRKEAQIFFYFYFFTEYLPKDLTSYLTYIWCNFGLITGILFRIWDLPRVKGGLRGYLRTLRILLGQSSLQRELKEVYG